MKPVRIEPAEIRVTLEISVTELRNLRTYFEKSEPFIKKVFGNDTAMQEVMSVINQHIKPVVEEILRHPLVE